MEAERCALCHADAPKNDRFAARVYAAVDRVPDGSVTTYKAVAAAVGSPGGAQAVARALASNPCPKSGSCPQGGARVVNCHRVVSVGGQVTGYLGDTSKEAIERRVSMLREEGVELEGGVVASRCFFDFLDETEATEC